MSGLRTRMCRGYCPVAVLLVFSILPAVSKADTTVWQDVQTDTVLSRVSGPPLYYRALSADTALLQAQLDAAPREFASSHGAELSLPFPDGTFQRFEIVESPIMEPGLAARYPEIRTYRAIGLDDPTASGRLDITPQGFHAMVIGASETLYIDPDGDAGHYRSYFKHDYGRALGRGTDGRSMCLVEGSEEGDLASSEGRGVALPRTGDQLRTYRLAVAATGEYTAFHGGSVSSALAAIVTAINRVNQIYGRDTALGFILVSNNDSIIYTNAASDPYDNSNASVIVAQNQANLDAVIGSSNYDIGHVFSTGSGGLAGLGVACNNSMKAAGTTGLPSPTGDPFHIDYVAHEIGHQMGANHTFNGTTSNCVAPNRNAATAYEPGSGSTVMAYAGICGLENLQSNSDATFHAASIAEINTYVVGAGACFSNSATGNSAPTVNAGGNFTIPRQTPFVLTANPATMDPDGHALSYQWDEMDVGTATTSGTGGTIGTDLGSNALFRSYLPKDVSHRHFPRLADQLTNIPNIGETLPSTARTLNFRLTARDGRYGVDEDDMQVVVHSGAGPFTVVFPNGGENLAAPFGTVNVTWNVASTNLAPVSCANVDIELLTFNASHTSYCSTLLADDTANDGIENGLLVTTANNANARIRISCSTNIFYDISNSDITISGAASSEPTNCVTTDGSNREHGTVSVDAGTNLSSGGGGGGGAFGPWSLALLGLLLGLHRRFRTRSV